MDLDSTSEPTTKYLRSVELKLVSQLSDRRSKYHPAAVASHNEKKKKAHMGIVIQDEGCSPQVSPPLKHD